MAQIRLFHPKFQSDKIEKDRKEKKITCEGERHLGAVVGSKEFKTKYVQEKVEKWVADIEELAQIAIDEPQLAYAAFTKGISHRWTYYMRTIPDISETLIPLEKKISEVFIPALLGRSISPLERDILELPVRLGGMGIINPVKISQREYQCSRQITKPLVQLISQQDQDITKLNREEVKNTKEQLKLQKEVYLRERFDTLYMDADHRLKNHLTQAKEKGASSWLTALPLKSLNYTLNKQEFQDGVHLRYGWQIKGMPQYCSCGKKNSI
ncbi:MAG: hypothetical protein GY816_22780, partial [Cytophagales bacterium]|nr:hypothetical protein [Cytophagales bacterium]